MTNEQLKCVKCGKVVGERIYDGGMNSPLGFIPCYHSKLDYRKAAHLALKNCTYICKTCARKIFPEGKSYTVRFNYHGKDMALFGNTEAYDKYATRADAEKVCKEMNDRHNGNTYRVVEHKL